MTATTSEYCPNRIVRSGKKQSLVRRVWYQNAVIQRWPVHKKQHRGSSPGIRKVDGSNVRGVSPGYGLASRPITALATFHLAEGEGFRTPMSFRTAVFKTAALRS